MESRGDLALYEYLYRCIRHDIAHGKVEPGQKLPSKRALAKQLGVSLITIEAAYDQLAAEGYIRSRERRGYYACDLGARRQDRGTGKRAAPSRDSKGDRNQRARESRRKPKRPAARFAKWRAPGKLNRISADHQSSRSAIRCRFRPDDRRSHRTPHAKRPARCAVARGFHAQHAGDHHAPLLRLGESCPADALGRIGGIAR